MYVIYLLNKGVRLNLFCTNQDEYREFALQCTLLYFMLQEVVIFHIERSAQFPIHISANFLYYSPLPPSNTVKLSRDNLSCSDSPEECNQENDTESDSSSES